MLQKNGAPRTLRRILFTCCTLAAFVAFAPETAQAGKIWLGPTPTGPEKPLNPAAKQAARKDARQAKKINKSWKKEFKKYEGYSHNPYGDLTAKALSVEI